MLTYRVAVEWMVQALDILSRTASRYRYRRRGRKVFEVNQDAIISAIRLFECLPLADAEEVLVGPLKGWLELPPEYDPEGKATRSLNSLGVVAGNDPSVGA